MAAYLGYEPDSKPAPTAESLAPLLASQPHFAAPAPLDTSAWVSANTSKELQ